MEKLEEKREEKFSASFLVAMKNRWNEEADSFGEKVASWVACSPFDRLCKRSRNITRALCGLWQNDDIVKYVICMLMYRQTRSVFSCVYLDKRDRSLYSVLME